MARPVHITPRLPPFRPGESLRVMTFNIRHASLADVRAVAHIVLAEAPDLVALQEVDVDTRRSGPLDQPGMLAELTGMHTHFFQALAYDGGQYGLAILSRWSIAEVRTVPLPSTGEQRILALAEVVPPAEESIHFAVTHLGLTAAERHAQAAKIVQILQPLSRVVVAGDFNAVPGSETHRILTRRFTDVWPVSGIGWGGTFPVRSPYRRIDWIMFSEKAPLPWMAWVPFTDVSDHLPLVSVFLTR